MIIDLKINTAEGITDVDRAVLVALAGGTTVKMGDLVVPAEATTTAPPTPEEKPVEEKPKPTRKPKPAAKKEAPAPVAEPEQEPEQEPQQEEAPAAPEENGAATIEDAIQQASALVAEGKASVVKAALGQVGADRVSNLTSDQVEEFLANLS